MGYLSVDREKVKDYGSLTLRVNFRFKSSYNVLSGANARMVDWRHFWDSYVPPRILVFCWVASLQKTLTTDQLRRKNSIIVNGFPLA